MDINKYLPLQYKDDVFDCYGLVKLIYKEELGITLPDYFYLGSTNCESVETAINLGSKDPIWTADTDPKKFSLCFFNVTGHIRHVGIHLGGNDFIHNFPSRNVTYEQLNNSAWGKRYRFSLRHRDV